MSEEELRSAISDGSVEQLLNWVQVQRGDTVLVHAGVVHALGAGVILAKSSKTRMSPTGFTTTAGQRELHLEKAMAVANRSHYEGRRELPVRCRPVHHGDAEVEGRRTPTSAANTC